jgi:hypothetical protein
MTVLHHSKEKNAVMRGRAPRSRGHLHVQWQRPSPRQPFAPTLPSSCSEWPKTHMYTHDTQRTAETGT